MKRGLKAADADSQDVARGLDAIDESPYLSLRRVAAMLELGALRNCRRRLERSGVPILRLGRQQYVERRVLDAVLRHG